MSPIICWNIDIYSISSLQSILVGVIKLFWLPPYSISNEQVRLIFALATKLEQTEKKECHINWEKGSDKLLIDKTME